MKISSSCTYSAVMAVMATTATAFTALSTNQVRTSLAASPEQNLSELIQLKTLEPRSPLTIAPSTIR